MKMKCDSGQTDKHNLRTNGHDCLTDEQGKNSMYPLVLGKHNTINS